MDGFYPIAYNDGCIVNMVYRSVSFWLGACWHLVVSYFLSFGTRRGTKRHFEVILSWDRFLLFDHLDFLEY